MQELLEWIRGEDLTMSMFKGEAKEGYRSYTGLEYSDEVFMEPYVCMLI